ncbi:glycoside hydrolase family 2, partial [Bacillus cereus]|nr:glycoside hydrolase family 2 [Bacillus cereus]
YWCDVKGMLVWSEMAATFEFNDQAVSRFTKEWLEIVPQQYNHPSIITWVPFNESWGISTIGHDVRQQQFTQTIYHLTKTIDPYRPVITNDGWEHTVSDILTLHDYVETGEEFLERYQDCLLYTSPSPRD